MRKTLVFLFKMLLVIAVVLWIGLICVECSRYQNNEPMLVVLKKEVKDYDDGHVYIYWGLGYKAITYERISIFGKEFGNFFIKEREKLPNYR